VIVLSGVGEAAFGAIRDGELPEDQQCSVHERRLGGFQHKRLVLQEQP
jgi:hypothetical protein